MHTADGDGDGLLIVVRSAFNLDDLRRLVWLVSDHVYALIFDFLLRVNVINGDSLALVRSLYVFFQERLVAEASITVSALRDFEVDFVVSTQRGLVAEGHEAGVALVRLVGAMDKCVFLQRRTISEFLTAELWRGSEFN